jgi:CheY-like chemotaxis protein
MPNRVLVVEDNPVLRELMLRQLSTFGVNCYAVEDAEEAVELAEFFDLILMDIQLPGMTGLEAAQAIRVREQERESPPITIVAVTCIDNPMQCLASGMDDYCAKPVTRAALHQLLHKWVFSRAQPLRALG